MAMTGETIQTHTYTQIGFGHIHIYRLLRVTQFALFRRER